MNTSKILSLCCLTACFVLCFGAFAMAEKPLPVEVTNTVPVQGTVNVGNTPLPVTVGNTPNVNVMNTVPVTGNVNVVNTPGNPIPVNVMKTPREIFRYTKNFGSDNHTDSFTVESTKRLVIEFASVDFGVVSPDQSPEDWGIQVALNIGGFQYIIPTTSAGRGILGVYVRVSAQPVKIYVEPGESVSIVCVYSGPGSFGGKLGLSGYYEEVPSP